jgi:ABC-type antimicrobial peptide transport system permease subunit
VVRRGLAAVLVGVGLGLAGAFELAELLEPQLYSVSAWDPLAFILAPVVLIAVALGATGLPALRAARVDPMATLRIE